MTQTEDDDEFRRDILLKLESIEEEKNNKISIAPVDVLRFGKLYLKKKTLEDDDYAVLTLLARYIITSLDSDNKTNFATVFLTKETIVDANAFIVQFISVIPRYIANIDGSRVSETKRWQTFLHFLLVFSNCSTWTLVKNNAQIQTILNGMCQKMSSSLYSEASFNYLSVSLYNACNDYKPIISLEALNVLFLIIFKPFRDNEGGQDLMKIFATKVMACPAIVYHLSKLNIDILTNSAIFLRILKKVREENDILENMEPQRMINFLGNIIHLGYFYLTKEVVEETIVDWTWILGVTMARCTEFAVKDGSRSNFNHWHPIFGLYKLPINQKSEGALKNVVCQLRFLWHSRIVSGLFTLALSNIDLSKPSGKLPTHHSKDITVAFSKLWKNIGGGSHSSSDSSQKVEEPPSLTAIVCNLYVSAMNSMQHLKNEIITGICHSDLFLRQLWAYLVKWGGNSELSPLNKSLQLLSNINSPHVAPLQLFAETSAFVISILDEEEMYLKGTPFPLNDLLHIAKFCNCFCFKTIWQNLVDIHSCEQGLFAAVHNLLMRLYARDCRKPFTTDAKFWLIPDVKSSHMVAEYERKAPRGLLVMAKMSHTIVLRDRMLYLRRLIAEEKCAIDGPATLITVVRNRVVEDGYRQLSLLTPKQLRNVIRVKFVNQQGLEEAGIDQDGVFKEFLELTIKQVFNPSLNLFTATSSGVLYPSTTSSIHPDHLALFQFIGRMLGKAVFEGIVVDVQLAPILLSALLGRRRFCAFDELSVLDPELYKNLTFIKRYEGDVSDLCLTFSRDEDFLGKVVTTDLIPGGRTITVTNENKIDYIHRMAHHRVFGQTKEQCKSFVMGIQSILKPQWLSLFAPHEIQLLLNGQSSDIDVTELKQHVQYYGGFHGSHRLIKWLWDIVEHEFSAEERKLFLKFVTSCSKPPLLGFSYLEPPFSIRCIEVSDDQDTGDTLGSVVRGFLALRRNQSTVRLPTASTCFNLLKLPNYNKKSLLLSKLRYAIHAESGFELS